MPPSKFRYHLSNAFEQFAGEVALVLPDRTYTYKQLRLEAEAVAEKLGSADSKGPVGVLGDRESTVYVGILAAIFLGRPYIPLNVKFPQSRLAGMVAFTGCSRIIADLSHSDRVAALYREVSGCERPNAPSASLAKAIKGNHGCWSFEDCDSERFNALHGMVYVLFTSGSTGVPKAIGIDEKNLVSYLKHATEVFGVRPGDRASQMFDLSFDLSMHDLFVTWLGGGALYVPSAADRAAPARFIVRSQLSHWFSVPSVASLLMRLRMLQPGTFDNLRQSLFCGEGLPIGIASAWHQAAPNSSVWNLYGPTEATIAISSYPFSLGNEVDHGQLVPIGTPFPGQHAKIVGPDFKEVEEGEVGELLLSGSQVADGYINDEERTASAFLNLPLSGGSDVWYRTGDLARQGEDEILHYLGRLDSQVQIGGHRVELGEIESAIRSASGALQVAACGWPLEGPNYETVVAFVLLNEIALSPDDILSKISSTLPSYMIPARIIEVREMPLNANGKIDRNALKKLLI